MSLQRQHFLLNYLKTPSVGPAGLWTRGLPLSKLALSNWANQAAVYVSIRPVSVLYGLQISVVLTLRHSRFRETWNPSCGYSDGRGRYWCEKWHIIVNRVWLKFSSFSARKVKLWREKVYKVTTGMKKRLTPYEASIRDPKVWDKFRAV